MSFIMNRSENINELVAALCKVQGALMVVKQETKGFNYTYASLPDIMRAAQPSLEAHGFCIVHQADDTNLSTYLYHVSGQWMSTSFKLILGDGKNMNANQARGSAITYAKRYNISCLLNITSDKDDDGVSSADVRSGEVRRPQSFLESQKAATASATISEKQCAELDNMLIELRDADFVNNLCTRLGVTSLYSMKPSDYTKVVNTIEKKIAMRGDNAKAI